GVNGELRGMIRWDLSEIPAGAQVERASIELDVFNISPGTYGVYGFQSSWSEINVTWNSINGAIDHDVVRVGSLIPSSTGSHTINLNAAGRSLIQSWVDGSRINNGLILKSEGTADGMDIRSSDYGIADRRPKLSFNLHTLPTDLITVIYRVLSGVPTMLSIRPFLFKVVLSCFLGVLNNLAYAHSGIHERIEAANRRIVEQPGDPHVYIHRAHILAEHGDWKRAFADLDRAKEHSAIPDSIAFDHALLLRQRGQQDGGTGLYHEALNQIDRYLILQPMDGNALLLRARLYHDLNNIHAALADYAQSIAITEKPQATLFIEQAELLKAIGRLDEAVTVLEQSINRLGMAVLPVIRMAIQLEAVQGRPGYALKWFQRLPSMIKVLPNELMLKGDLLREAGSPVQARSIYCEAWKRLVGFPAWRRQQPVFINLDIMLSERLVKPCD
ncbi:MAG: DNRLRE domain-containing protein, partial [Candidatus Thiodiazotropha sp. (ex Lucinoma borealis)]|nr:DNRLRE domain-containing protein [Candidatus Thiodiazotropha sp. (ex Lucinoma borealis)]